MSVGSVGRGYEIPAKSLRHREFARAQRPESANRGAQAVAIIRGGQPSHVGRAARREHQGGGRTFGVPCLGGRPACRRHRVLFSRQAHAGRGSAGGDLGVGYHDRRTGDRTIRPKRAAVSRQQEHRSGGLPGRHRARGTCGRHGSRACRAHVTTGRHRCDGLEAGPVARRLGPSRRPDPDQLDSRAHEDIRLLGPVSRVALLDLRPVGPGGYLRDFESSRSAGGRGIRRPAPAASLEGFADSAERHSQLPTGVSHAERRSHRRRRGGLPSRILRSCRQPHHQHQGSG